MTEVDGKATGWRATYQDGKWVEELPPAKVVRKKVAKKVAKKKKAEKPPPTMDDEDQIEPVEEIRARLAAALDHIDGERLIAAPDCGLGLLGRELAREKMTNLCRAAREV